MSTRDRVRIETLASDAALFGLDEGAQRELDALGPDEGVMLELELAAAEVAVVAFMAEETAPEALPEALAAKLRAGAREERAALPSARVATPPRRRSSTVAWVLAAAAILVAVAGWTRRPPPPIVVVPAAPPTREVPADARLPAARERAELLTLPGTSRTAWKATADDAGASASGDIVWHSGVQRGVMRFEGLAPNDPARFQYQLWIFDAGRDEAQPVDGGVFDVGSNGELLVPVTAKLKVGEAKLFAITVERPGGVVVSKRERIVLTASPSS